MDKPIERLSPAMLFRLLELRPDMRNEIIAEMKRRGIQVVET